MSTERIKKAETIALMLYIFLCGYYAGSSHSAAWIVFALGSILYLAAVLVLEHLKKAPENTPLPK